MTGPIHPIPQKSCINCHFLARDLTPPKTPICVSESLRRELREGKSTLGGGDVLLCFHGVWNERLDDVKLDGQDRPERVMWRNREKYCFFWPYHGGMSFEAAAELQKREADNSAINSQLRRNTITIWVAIFALAFNGLTLMLNFLKAVRILP